MNVYQNTPTFINRIFKKVADEVYNKVDLYVKAFFYPIADRIQFLASNSETYKRKHAMSLIKVMGEDSSMRRDDWERKVDELYT